MDKKPGLGKLSKKIGRTVTHKLSDVLHQEVHTAFGEIGTLALKQVTKSRSPKQPKQVVRTAQEAGEELRQTLQQASRAVRRDFQAATGAFTRLDDSVVGRLDG